MGEQVYAVHATRPEEVGSVEVIFSDEQAARAYAISRSTDHRVLAVSVTEFVMGRAGHPTPRGLAPRRAAPGPARIPPRRAVPR